MERYFSYVKNNFGNTLREIRRNKNITQNQAATMVTDQSTIGKIERTQIQPSYLKVAQLTYNLNCNFQELLFLSGNKVLDKKSQAFAYIRQCRTKKDLPIAKAGLKFCEEVYTQTNDSYFFSFMTCFKLWILYTENHGAEVPDDIIADVQQMWRQVIDMEQWYLTELYFISMIILVLPFNQRGNIGETALKIVNSYRGVPQAEFIKNHLLESLLMITLETRQFTEAQHYCYLLLNECVYPLTDATLGLATYINGLLDMRVHAESAAATIRRGLMLSYLADEYSNDILNQFAMLIIGEDYSVKIADFQKSIDYLIK